MITVKNLHSLPNAFHFETVMKTLERIGATSVAQENVGVRPLFEDLQAKFQREDTAYRQSLKSFKTDEPQEAGRRGRARDRYAGACRNSECRRRRVRNELPLIAKGAPAGMLLLLSVANKDELYAAS